MATSGNFSTSNQYIKYRIIVDENSTSIANNTSNVTVRVQVWRTNSGFTSVYLNDEREATRTEKTNLAKIVGKTVLKETGADIVFLNAGAFLSSIEIENIKMADVLRVFSLGNSIVTKSVSGENIIKALELALRQYPKMSALSSSCRNDI